MLVTNISAIKIFLFNTFLAIIAFFNYKNCNIEVIAILHTYFCFFIYKNYNAIKIIRDILAVRILVAKNFLSHVY